MDELIEARLCAAEAAGETGYGPPAFQFDIVDALIRLDEGTLEEEEFIELFQYLIDTGLARTLQGRIGRTANDLIESGHCHRPGEQQNG